MIFLYFISYLSHSGTKIMYFIDSKRQDIFSTEPIVSEEWKTIIRP